MSAPRITKSTKFSRSKSLIIFSRSRLINYFEAVFCDRELSHDDAPTARRMPARGNAPGMDPSICSALQGRRIPPPLQGVPINSETQGVALGWSTGALSAANSKTWKLNYLLVYIY